MIKGFPAASKSSMLEDLERGRSLELPWLSGAVVRLGKEGRRADADPPVHHRGLDAVRGTAERSRIRSTVRGKYHDRPMTHPRGFAS